MKVRLDIADELYEQFHEFTDDPNATVVALIEKWVNKKYRGQRSEIANVWKKQHFDRYKANLAWGPKESAQLKHLLKSISGTDLVDVIRFYFAWNEPYYVKSCHSFGLFVKQFGRIYTTFQNPKVIEDQIQSEWKYEQAKIKLKVRAAMEDTFNEPRRLNGKKS